MLATRTRHAFDGRIFSSKPNLCAPKFLRNPSTTFQLSSSQTDNRTHQRSTQYG